MTVDLTDAFRHDPSYSHSYGLGVNRTPVLNVLDQ